MIRSDRRVFKARPGLRWYILVGVVITGGAMLRTETQAQAKRPASTVQQLMQAIVFPNANLIFAAEGNDPATVARDVKPSASTNPLTGLYGGWQAVENSSLALLESADLLNVSGRIWADGTPVPVDESEWKAEIEYAQPLIRRRRGVADNQDDVSIRPVGPEFPRFDLALAESHVAGQMIDLLRHELQQLWMTPARLIFALLAAEGHEGVPAVLQL
jgi:hypothetical protein